VSAVDAPPGLAFAGEAAGEFVARPASRKLATRVFVYVAVAAGVTFALASRQIHAPFVEMLLIVPLVCVSVAAVGFAVRRARVRIDADGVWWGWRLGGVRMRRARIRRACVYTDAVALVPRRGSTWFLTRRDWHQFSDMARALRAAGISFTRRDRRAPLGARLQSYGLVLDALMLLDALLATGALAVATAL
jgi:hypothetical protein